MFKENHKFWAFVLLVFAITGLGIVASSLGTDGSRFESINEAQQAILQARLRILELIAVGLIGIAGAAGQSLFRTSENANAMNDILKSTIEGLKQSQPVNDNTTVPKDAAEGARAVANVAEDKAEKIEQRVGG
jgi:hypothetical protein